jgi:hypothetical protein
MPNYQQGKSFPPKLWESFKTGGDCAVCGDGIEAGQNGWLYKSRIACPHHSKADVIAAIDEGPELRKEAPKPDAVEFMYDGQMIEAMKAQTRALEALVVEVRKAVDIGIKVRP